MLIDWELIQGVRSASRTHEEKLYQIMCKGSILHWFARKTHIAVAEEYAHDAYLAMIVAIRNDAILEPSKVRGYVSGILKNQVLLYINRRSSKREDPLKEIAYFNTYDDDLARTDCIKNLFTAINKLPTLQGQVYRMIAEGKDYKEILVDLDISYNTFRKAKLDGMRKLRGLM